MSTQYSYVRDFVENIELDRSRPIELEETTMCIDVLARYLEISGDCHLFAKDNSVSTDVPLRFAFSRMSERRFGRTHHHRSVEKGRRGRSRWGRSCSEIVSSFIPGTCLRGKTAEKWYPRPRPADSRPPWPSPCVTIAHSRDRRRSSPSRSPAAPAARGLISQIGNSILPFSLRAPPSLPASSPLSLHPALRHRFHLCHPPPPPRNGNY